MTIQLNNLTVEATTEEARYEITSIKDEAGREVHATPELLDQIEEAIEDPLQADAFEESYWNAENPAFLRLF